MMKTLSELKSYQVYAQDGKIGHIRHVLIDLHKWAARYLVVDSKTLRRNIAIISPYAIARMLPREKMIELNISAHEIDKAPHFNDPDFPFPSKRHEESYHHHFNWAPYWIGDSLWGRENIPNSNSHAAVRKSDAALQVDSSDCQSHLVSSTSLIGFSLHVHEGFFGKLEGFLIDEESWSIKYLVIESEKSNNSVIVPPQWITHLDVRRGDIYAELSETQIRGCPSYEGVRSMGRAVQDGHYFAYDPNIVSYTKTNSRPPLRTHA